MVHTLAFMTGERHIFTVSMDTRNVHIFFITPHAHAPVTQWHNNADAVMRLVLPSLLGHICLLLLQLPSSGSAHLVWQPISEQFATWCRKAMTPQFHCSTDRFFSRNVRCFLSPNIEEEASHSAGNCMSIHLQMLQMSSSKILSVCIGLPLWQQLKTWLWLVWEWIHHGRLCREGGDLLFCGRSLSLATQEPQTLTNNPQLSY